MSSGARNKCVVSDGQGERPQLTRPAGVTSIHLQNDWEKLTKRVQITRMGPF